MFYTTHLIIVGEFRSNKKILKTANLKSKCNLHDNKLQYLSGSDKKSLLSEHHFYSYASHVSYHNTVRGKITS